MDKLRNVSRRRFLAAVATAGFIIDESRGKGSHAIIYHRDEPSRRATLPKRDPIAAGTLRSIMRGLDLSRGELLQLLRPSSGEDPTKPPR